MKTKNHHAVALGRIGGQTTGPTKARKVTSAMAKKAADARWSKKFVIGNSPDDCGPAVYRSRKSAQKEADDINQKFSSSVEVYEISVDNLGK